MRVVSGLVLLGVLLSVAPATHAARGPCSTVSEVISVGAGGTGTVVDTDGISLLSTKGVICGVSFIANANNGWCQVYDSPDGTTSHAQIETKAEKGAASSGDSDSGEFEGGLPTRFGIGVDVSGGRCLVHFGTTP